MKVSERKIVERVRQHATALLDATSYVEEYLERTRLAEAIADLVTLAEKAEERKRKHRG